MSDSDFQTPHNSSGLDHDFINKLFISGSTLPFNSDDLVNTNTRLGTAQFEVMQYHFKPTGLDIAVKQFSIQKTKNKWKRKHGRNDTNKSKDKLLKEADILSQLKHSNDIVEFYGLCFGRDYALLCMELMDMNLSQLYGIILKFQMSTPSDVLGNTVVTIIDGLEYCHRKNIIHRDIKPENILVKRNGNFKIGDFSESRVMDATITGNYTGTILYWSPERVRSTEVKDPKYDIWGLGMTLLEIICGFHPIEKLLGMNFDINNYFEFTQFIENIDPETLLQGAIQKTDEANNKYGLNYTELFARVLELISRCLKRVDERATIHELQNTFYYKYAQEECRYNGFLMEEEFVRYEELCKTLFVEENFKKLDTLIFEENSRRYNLSYSELQFRLLLYHNEKREIEDVAMREMNICYHANADKWIILKNYFKYPFIIEYLNDELTFLHKFSGQPFIPQFYGWGPIKHNMNCYSVCFEVMDMNLREFYSQFINNFGYEAFKQSLSEGILGYISSVVFNALLEIHIKGFSLHNINSTNILLNDRGEVKLCGFSFAKKYEDIDVIIRNTLPSDVWCYAATLIEFACGDQPSCFKELGEDFHLRFERFPEEESELKEISKNCFSMEYSHQPHEFFMECLKKEDVEEEEKEEVEEEEEDFYLKQRVEPNFDALMKMDFYQQALKNIEENKAHLAKWVQRIIIAETRDTVPVQWFHKFMDPKNAKIYDTFNDYQ